jgi:hypothetical protein
MDPEATWNELVEAIISRNRLDAISSARTLIEWLNRGGFPPKVSLKDLSSDWQSYFCRRACESVVHATEDLWKESHDIKTRPLEL